MKYFLLIMPFFSLFSCRNETHKGEGHINLPPHDSVKSKPDSFNTDNLDYMVSIQGDIELDTIHISRNRRHMGITIIIPRLSEKVYYMVGKKLSNIVKNKREEFLDLTKDDVVEYDSLVGGYVGFGMLVEPRSLYRARGILSFIIATIEGYTTGTSSLDYSVINFDNNRKKQISLGDYFVLNSRSDTIFLDKIIGRAINRQFSIREYLSENGYLNFGFDNSNVYFCFDKYDPYSWGISSVKKEYILDHISPTYR